MATLYTDLIVADCETGNHESDLHVRDTPRAREIIKAHKPAGTDGWCVQQFTSAIDGTPWLDIAFAYDPWWAARGVKVAP